MTAVVARVEDDVRWGVMPGWDIVGDLTPPELIDQRRLVVIRRWLAAGLLGLVVLIAAGFAFAVHQHSAASDEADAAADRTVTLQGQTSKYSGVTRLESVTQSTDAQIAQLLGNDVDVARVVASVRTALPASMTIQSLSITFNAAVAGASSPTTANGLDMSGKPEIGTITVSGQALAIDNLPTFVDRLGAIPGVVNVLPTSNQAGDTANSRVQYSLTASMTSQLLSHAFAHGPTGGK